MVITSLFRGYRTPQRDTDRRFAALDALAGSPFVTNLRIAWMRAEQHALNDANDMQFPLTVQLLGTSDTLVAQEDSREIERSQFNAHIAIDQAGHADIIRIFDSDSDRTKDILEAIGGTILPTTPPELPAEERDIDSVVLLVHGIRAGVGGWAADLADRLQEKMPNALVDRVSYGYFSALKFALPFGHQNNFRKFATRYSYLAARHPDAKFHVAAHSNGTIVVGWVLRAIDQMDIERLYLAGSVLPDDFDWTLSTVQVTDMVNACGRSDVPVGWLCRGLRGVGRRNIGHAGYAGFQSPRTGSDQLVDLTKAHDAGLRAQRLPAVADYIAHGTQLTGRPEWETKGKGFLFNLVSNGAGIITFLAGAALPVGAGWPCTGRRPATSSRWPPPRSSLSSTASEVSARHHTPEDMSTTAR